MSILGPWETAFCVAGGLALLVDLVLVVVWGITKLGHKATGKE